MQQNREPDAPASSNRAVVLLRRHRSRLAAAAVVGLLGVPSLLGQASASFTTTTVNSGNSLTAFAAGRPGSFTFGSGTINIFGQCQFNFTWTDSPTAGVTGYVIERLNSGGTVTNTINLAATANSATDGNWFPGTNPGNSWRIHAVTAAGVSAWVTSAGTPFPAC